MAQLSNFPLGYNINNLRTFPSRVLGLPALGGAAVPNPTSWSLNANSYAQLCRENPWFTLQVFTGDTQRFQQVRETAGQ